MPLRGGGFRGVVKLVLFLERRKSTGGLKKKLCFRGENRGTELLLFVQKLAHIKVSAVASK
jgi:hypothetical protein